MKHSIKHYLFKLKWPFAIILFIVVTGFVGENCWLHRIEQKREIIRLKSEIDDYNRKYEAENKVLKSMKYDPDATTQVAREKYYMKKADEDVFVFENEYDKNR